MDIPDHDALASLTRAAQQGDVGACGRIVRCTQSLVNAVVRRVVADPQEAEDVVQETYLRAHLRLARLRDPASLVAWLQRIARHWQPRHRVGYLCFSDQVCAHGNEGHSRAVSQGGQRRHRDPPWRAARSAALDRAAVLRERRGVTRGGHPTARPARSPAGPVARW
jgi:hypothetical protein